MWAMYWPPERSDQGRGEAVESWSEHWAGIDIGGALAGFEQRAHYMFAAFDRHIRPGDAILEGGCGLGQIALYYHRRGHAVVGLDFDTRTLRRIREFDNTLPMTGGDVMGLPFADQSFDVYISMGVVEHFRSGPEAALREAHRILKPGGRLIITVPQANRYRSLGRARSGGQRRREGWWSARFGSRDMVQVVDVAREGEDRPPVEGATFFQYVHTPGSFRSRLEAAGLKVTAMHGVSIEAGLSEALPPKARAAAVAPATGAAAAPTPARARGPLRSWLRSTLIQERDEGPNALLVRQLQASFGNMLLAVATPA